MNKLEELAFCLVIPSPIISILGIGQLFLNWHSPSLLLGWELIAKGNPEGRMSSLFMYANILAIYLLIILSISLGLALKNYYNYRKNKLIFIGLFIKIIINSIALILTNSRNAWVIALIIFLAYTIYLRLYSLLAIFTAFTTIILGASFAPAPISNPLRNIVPEYFWARLSDQMYPDRPLETLRITQWRFSWDLTIKHPFTGWGLRNFSHLYEQKMNIWLGHPHNIFLMLSAETGVILTLYFCGLIGYILARAIILLKQIKSEARLTLFSYLLAFSSCVLFNLFDVSIFDLRINTLTWLLLAAIYGITLNLSGKTGT
jgi:O-antigen ligase